ncbi:ArnT family glycosyltransferase [Hyphobacterium sp.]|uniref:ArnT family glycosyltransferase n=1 Tax=Hyphobacterium sp. TaxID=2004662 RepID=UPI003BAC6F8A
MLPSSQTGESRAPLYWGAMAILAIALLRILGLAANQLQLYPDEAQYWVWSWTIEWGYFSKPPLIAWVIGLSTSILGDTDFAIRLPSLLFHTMGAVFLMLIAHRVAGGWAGLFAALVYLTMPGVGIGAMVISTDSLLLPLWAGALYCLIRLRDGEGGWVSAAGLGLFLGLAFLAKYAAIYFLIGTVLALVFDRPVRRALLSFKGLLAAVLLLSLWGPNLLWNASNDFATVQHTAANANWQGSLFNFEEMLGFVGEQFGVFGFLSFPAMLIAAVLAWRTPQRTGQSLERLLTLYCLPALAAVSVQAFISRAHANWAASAYVAGTLLVVFLLLRGPRWRRYILIASIAAGAIFSATVSTVAAQPSLVAGQSIARGVRHLQSWPETAEAIAPLETRGNYTALVFDNRNVFHQMQRYGRNLQTPLAMWQRYGTPHNQAEAVWALDDGTPGPVLIIADREWERARLLADFERVEEITTLSIPTGGHADRRLTVYEGYNYRRLQRDADYEARFSDAMAAGSASGADETLGR